MKAKLFYLLFSLVFLIFAEPWEMQRSPVRVALNAVHFPNDTLKGYIAGDSGVVLTTVNSGNNWQISFTNITASLKDIWAINDTIYACGAFGSVIKSVGGLMWEWKGGFTFNNLNTITFPRSGLVGYVFGDQGTAFRTTNGGDSWRQLNLGVNANIYGCYFINNAIGYVCGSNGTVLKTTDGGVNWQAKRPGPNITFYDIYFLDQNTGYVCGEQGYIFKTTNGGDNWNLEAVPEEMELYSISFPVSADTGYFCGIEGKIGKRKGRDRWELIYQAQGTLRSICFPVNNLVGWVVGDNGIILKTRTGGTAALKEVNNIPLDELAKGNIIIYNSCGIKILEKKGSLAELNQNKALKPGLYFIKLESNNKKIIQKRVIIN